MAAQLKNLYKVVYDIRFGRTWAGNSNGWGSENVLANGDARVAGDLVERRMLRTEFGEGRLPNKVRILEITRIASDVLV